VLLVDTSVWIRLDRGQISLYDVVSDEEDLATCPMIIHEFLRGTRNAAHFELVLETLTSLEMLDAPTPYARFQQAAEIYKRCRVAGVTPSTPDAIIAACAIANNVPLLHYDKDFTHIARAIPELQLLTRS